MVAEYPILYVGGVEREWQAGSLTVNQAINQRSSCDFTIVEKPGEEITIQRGSVVQVWDVDHVNEEVLIFNGVAERVSRKAILSPDNAGIYIEVRCVDAHYYIDKRVVTNSFDNQSAGDSVRDLIRTTLAEENIYDHSYPGAAISVARGDILGYWRLGYNADDDSWWANTVARTDGTEIGSITYTAENPDLPADFTSSDASPINDANLGGHADIDGDANYVETGRGADALSLYGSGDGFTVSIWVWDTGSHSTWGPAVSCGNSSSLAGVQDNLFSLRKQDEGSGGEMRFWAYDTGSEGVYASDPNGVLTEGAWINFVGVADQVNEEIRLYRDGILVDTTSVPGGFRDALTSGNPHVLIGADPTGGSHFWPGFVSECLYVGRPFTDHEVALHFTGAGISYRSQVVRDGVISYWPMDDDASSNVLVPLVGGESERLTLQVGGDGQVTNVDGGMIDEAQAIEFDGDGDRYEGTLDYDYAQSGGYSVEFWIRRDVSSDNSTGSFPAMFQISGGGRGTVLIHGTPDTGTLEFQPRLDGNFDANATATVNDAEWQHVVFTHADTGTALAYVNGTEVDSQTITWIEDLYGDISVGANSSADALDWDGQHLALYDFVLTPSEVADHYYKGREYYNSNHLDLPETRAETGASVERVNFNYVDGGKALNKLADVSEFEYFVDSYRTIHFHARGARCCNAAFPINSGIMLDGSVDLLLETPKYRNRQYIKGGKDQTQELTEVVEITSEGQDAFPTSYPIADLTSVEEDLDDDGTFETTASTAIRSDSTGTADYYWSRGEVGVAKDSDRGDWATGEVGGKVRITYTGLFPLVAIAEDTDEVTSLLDTEKAGTGRVEGVIEDGSIESRQQGFDLASFQLARYAQRAETVKFTTRAAGLRPGQFLTIDLPRLDISSFPALIESVDCDDFGGIEFRYSIKAVSGATLQSWHRFFSEAAKAVIVPQEQVNINEDEIAISVVTLAETITLSETLSPSEQTCVTLSDPGPSLPFTLC